jgi:hypothetical protein
MMTSLDLQVFLLRGTATWHPASREQQSTTDLGMATPELADDMIHHTTEGTEHGSDHQVIRITFNMAIIFKADCQGSSERERTWLS